MEYAIPERRTTRKDLKRKNLFNKYKRGGSERVNNNGTITKTVN
jgi:hypothetical protein